MKTVVLVPSPEYRHYAGARIRYGRIAPALEQGGSSLVLQDLGDFAPERAEADVFIVSKCYDSRALVAAAVLAERGCLVGIDVFDDYFSQLGDSRLSRYHIWLSQILRSCSFALCSTDAMKRVVEQYQPQLPIHVMNDPGPAFDEQKLAQTLRLKSLHVREMREMIVAWFGNGDNPYFPVGLHDLAAFSSSLRELSRSGLDVQLRILTNSRALTADGLALVKSLPVPATIAEWSEDAEKDLLAEAFLAFLPVNFQPFSAAKSLNRAITALGAGCQVLSDGFPLYRAIDTLVYRDPNSLLQDIEDQSLRHSPDHIGEYQRLIERIASRTTEAGRLADFLSVLGRPTASSDTLVLLHGHASSGAAHKLVHSAGGLSVASPYCSARLGFDVVFQGRRDGLAMFVSEKAAKRLLPVQHSRLRPGSLVDGKRFMELAKTGTAAAAGESLSWSEAPLPFQLATYGESMRSISTRLTEAFGPCKILVSEMSPLPFSLLP
jgi:hypothetical protein